MNPLQVGQSTAIYDAQGEVITVGNTGTSLTETIVSGTPFQPSASHATVLYIEVTTAAALSVQMGPSSSGTGVTVSTSESAALGVTTVEVPAGWYVDLTGTVADFIVTAVVSA
jgi:hypothetical protein